MLRQVACHALGSFDSRVHFVDGFHAGWTGTGYGGVGFGEAPHRVERDDFTGVAAHDGRRNIAEGFENRGACLADAGRDRVEHPGFAVLMQFLCDFGQCVLEER